MNNEEYYKITVDDLYTNLKTSSNGLTTEEVQKRIAKYGLNELPKKKKDSIFKIIFSEIADPIILLLIVAIIASVIIHHIDHGMARIFLNTIVRHLISHLGTIGRRCHTPYPTKRPQNLRGHHAILYPDITPTDVYLAILFICLHNYEHGYNDCCNQRFKCSK